MKRISIVALILVSCAIGCVSSMAFIVPAARAQDVKRWDYLCLDVRQMLPDEIQEKSKLAGKEGWEMTAVTLLTVCFKRPL
ncbi:MAG: hypothetical protein ACM34E_19220 [Acidobacteriota bacterium]